MLDNIPLDVEGFIEIKDKTTGEILVQKKNAVHYGNISTSIAKALTGDNTSFINYMVFGNAGVIVNSSGKIVYRQPNVSLSKNPNAQLYNTTFIKELTNNSYNDTEKDEFNYADSPDNAEHTSNFSDIIIEVELTEQEPPIALNMDNSDGSSGIDDSNVAVADDTTFVFNELALYTSPRAVGDEFTNFENEASANQSIANLLFNQESRLITHVIFHPIQKSQNRVLQITYTLRIQMGCN